jgi:hypothetical protein
MISGHQPSGISGTMNKSYLFTNTKQPIILYQDEKDLYINCCNILGSWQRRGLSDYGYPYPNMPPRDNHICDGPRCCFTE